MSPSPRVPTSPPPQVPPSPALGVPHSPPHGRDVPTPRMPPRAVPPPAAPRWSMRVPVPSATARWSSAVPWRWVTAPCFTSSAIRGRGTAVPTTAWTDCSWRCVCGGGSGAGGALGSNGRWVLGTLGGTGWHWVALGGIGWHWVALGTGGGSGERGAQGIVGGDSGVTRRWWGWHRGGHSAVPNPTPSHRDSRAGTATRCSAGTRGGGAVLPAPPELW